MTIHFSINDVKKSLKDKLSNRKTLQKIVANSGWLFFDKGIRLGINLFINIWLARYLGPASFGIFNYIISFVVLFNPLVLLGLNQILVKYIVQHPGLENIALGTGFFLKLVSGLLGWILAIVAIQLIRPGDSQTLKLLTVYGLTMIWQAMDVVDFNFQAKIQSKFVVIARGIPFLVISVSKIVCLILKMSLDIFIILQMGEILLSAIALFITYEAKYKNIFQWRFNLSCAKTLLKQSLPLILSAIAIVFYMRMDQIMLRQMINEQAVGLYSIAVRLSEFWYILPTILVGSVFPHIIELRERNQKLYYERLQKMFSLLTIMAYIIAITFSLLASTIIPVLFGEVYREAAPILSIHVWTGIFAFLGVARGSWIISEGLMNYALLANVAGAVLNFILNLILISRYGPRGAAIATLVSQIISVYLMMLLFKETRKIFYIQTKALLLHGIRTQLKT